MEAVFEIGGEFRLDLSLGQIVYRSSPNLIVQVPRQYCNNHVEGHRTLRSWRKTTLIDMRCLTQSLSKEIVLSIGCRPLPLR